MPEAEYTLITGASGFIGRALAERLSAERPVICLSRNQPKDHPNGSVFVQGEFHSFEDLRRLDTFSITCAVHLAAVTGGSTEEDALSVNVSGTRRLLRYLIDRGCRKYVLASSIAAIGCLDGDFLPIQIPIPDDHPCLARDAYGFSKALMEDVTRYINRVTPESDFIHLRLGSVLDDEGVMSLYTVSAPPRLPFVELARIMRSDVVRAFERAIAAPRQDGVRVYNVVGPDAACADPVSDILEACLGARIAGLIPAWFKSQDHAYAALYSMEKIRRELDFVPETSTRVKDQGTPKLA